MELQLPFIKTIYPDIPVLPVYCRASSAGTRKQLASVLAEFENSIIIISTNLAPYTAGKRALEVAEDFVASITCLPGEPLETISAISPGEWEKQRKKGVPAPCGTGILEGWTKFSKIRYPGKKALIINLGWGEEKKDRHTDQNEKAGISQGNFRGCYGAFLLRPGN